MGDDDSDFGRHSTIFPDNTITRVMAEKANLPRTNILLSEKFCRLCFPFDDTFTKYNKSRNKLETIYWGKLPLYTIILTFPYLTILKWKWNFKKNLECLYRIFHFKLGILVGREMSGKVNYTWIVFAFCMKFYC